MNVKLKYLALALGLIGLLAAPVGAESNSWERIAGEPPSENGGFLLAGSGSLLATGNREPAAKMDPQTPAPNLIAAEPWFDFGRVLEGTEVVHDFLIENRGNGDLAIDRVRTG